jgi:hypothetical protein
VLFALSRTTTLLGARFYFVTQESRLVQPVRECSQTWMNALLHGVLLRTRLLTDDLVEGTTLLTDGLARKGDLAVDAEPPLVCLYSSKAE